MPRRTKIVATLGPATTDPAVLQQIIEAGVDVVRLNFSHGFAEEHTETVKHVRRISAEVGREVGVLADLQGPKIRIKGFREGRVLLEEGHTFTLDIQCPATEGDEHRVGISYRRLPKDVQPGDTLLLDDGRIELIVDVTTKDRVVATVTQGGELSGNKGVNVLGGGLSAQALTSKDRRDAEVAIRMGADFLALSFCRCKEDVFMAQRILRKAGGHAAIVAKIERVQALENLEEIVEAADAVMVARGDLGVEIGDAKLPAAQKKIIHTARTMNKVTITATQMMESMIENPIPTRAEVFDVANAVLDGTDAVMLSAETAMGRYPAKVVSAMGRICHEAEQHRLLLTSDYRVNDSFRRRDEAVAVAAMYAANKLRVKAIAAMTESGTTPLWMSRVSSGIPIYAMSRNLETLRKVTLYRGVYPLPLPCPLEPCEDDEHQEAVKELLRRGVVEKGDTVITTCGDVRGKSGGANNMKIQLA
jgi:pyruvate kinase